MLWIIILVGGIVIGTICAVISSNNASIVAMSASATSFIIAASFGLIGTVFYIQSVAGYKNKIAAYEEKEKQITYMLEVYSDNANFVIQFGDAMNSAYKYNLDLVDDQTAYKNHGCAFLYRNYEIMDLPIIDITKYKVKDSKMNIKMSN